MKGYLVAGFALLGALSISVTANAQQTFGAYLAVRECPIQVQGQPEKPCRVSRKGYSDLVTCERVRTDGQVGNAFTNMAVILRIEPGTKIEIACEGAAYAFTVPMP